LNPARHPLDLAGTHRRDFTIADLNYSSHATVNRLILVLEVSDAGPLPVARPRSA
jgi:hypothetical protein